jgi:3-phenylpropionate/trans-cinnamate dioxygenase ferredoxin reductase subunit
MSTYRVTLATGAEFKAQEGQTLLDAALRSGVDLPYDCRAGVCGTCRVTVLEGQTAGGETGDPTAVLACQARPRADIKLDVDETPPLQGTTAQVVEVNELGWGVVEVVMAPRQFIPALAGQYMRFEWKGFPARSYSPTQPLLAPATPGLVRLHVRRVRNGLVSNAFGREIRPGHKVRILGPYGSAYLRSRHEGRLVLVGTGTGFAPIWSIAHQALCERPDREMIMLAGARSPSGLYMVPALERLGRFPRVHVRPFVTSAENGVGQDLVATIDEILPMLRGDDMVFVAGSGDTVRETMALCASAGVPCHADCFSNAPLRDEWPERRAFRRPSAPLAVASASSKVARQISAKAVDRPVCVLVCSVENDQGPQLCEAVAERLTGPAKPIILGVGVSIPAKGSGETSRAWRSLPTPPQAHRHDADPGVSTSREWPRKAAVALGELRRHHDVILISVPPMADSTLAWGFASVCDLAVVLCDKPNASAIACRSLRANGIPDIIEVAAARDLAAA